ncbi:TPA: hypothetical protein MHL26_15590 [Klebsiella quasipneumoniae]|nr:hypothetical protein [Klebsiella quasipneumoniae]HBZ3630113.1 hypothetical protein [Klebsiella quasipneumoniae]
MADNGNTFGVMKQWLSFENKNTSRTRNYSAAQERFALICVEMMKINTRKIPNFLVAPGLSTIKQDAFLSNYL